MCQCRGQAVPKDQMPPPPRKVDRTGGPHKLHPPRYEHLGQDVPCQDRFTYPHPIQGGRETDLNMNDTTSKNQHI